MKKQAQTKPEDRETLRLARLRAVKAEKKRARRAAAGFTKP